MRRVIASLLVIGLVLVACGGGTVDNAENCAELTQALADIGDMTDDELDRAGEKATEFALEHDEGGEERALCVEVLVAIGEEFIERILDSASG